MSAPALSSTNTLRTCEGAQPTLEEQEVSQLSLAL